MTTNSLFSQIKIEFRDGKNQIVSGELVASYTELDENSKPYKEFQTYLYQSDTLFTFSVYSQWKTENALNRMDELRIYRLTQSQLERTPSIYENTNDQDQITHYSLSFSSQEERPFIYEVFNIYSSTPEKRQFSLFKLDGQTEESLQKIAVLFPEQVLEEE